MASTARVLFDAPGMIVVRVDHLDTDSFSRSVNRAANKAWKHTRNANTALYTTGRYGMNDHTEDYRQCASLVVYGTSHPNARVLLDTWLHSGAWLAE
jgi:hypothetical protein